MNQSLSVVLPVHNAESTLARQVAQLLEILPDLTPRFEVVIVDDGSTDHTEESAHELAREYPQLRVVRHAERLGVPAVLETGMQHAAGDVVFVHDDTAPMSPSELRRLWAMQSERPTPPAPPGRMQNLDGGVLGRLMVWGAAIEPKKSAVRTAAPLATVLQSLRQKTPIASR